MLQKRPANTLRPAEQPIVESDEFIERALQHAGIPALMMSMIHMTGDASLLDGPIRPNTAILGGNSGLFTTGATGSGAPSGTRGD